MTRGQLIISKREYLLRLAEWLHLHAYENMSTKQLAGLIYWRITRSSYV